TTWSGQSVSAEASTDVKPETEMLNRLERDGTPAAGVAVPATKTSDPVRMRLPLIATRAPAAGTNVTHVERFASEHVFPRRSRRGSTTWFGYVPPASSTTWPGLASW